jgi:D-alanyl-D-alanine carboxypeptidase
VSPGDRKNLDLAGGWLGWWKNAVCPDIVTWQPLLRLGYTDRMLRPVSLAIVSLALLASTAFARGAKSESNQAQSFPWPPLRAHAGVVMDANSGIVLASVNKHLHLPMASTTKVMTALVAIENGSLIDKIKVPKAAFNYESDATIMGLHPGQVVTLRDLLYGLLLPSGADAANTIAIHYGGSEAGFVAMMNAEAKRLGMADTHYVNAHGLTAANHYTSALDLAILGRYASGTPDLMAIVKARSHVWNGHVLTNINRPLFWYPGVDGIKPGYTDDAGLCQLLDAQRHGRHVIVALLNTPDLVVDARNYLNFGLRDFSWIQSSLTGDGPGLEQQGADRKGKFLFFPASGHYLHGPFIQAYQAFGGLPALGFPRTEPLAEVSRQVQYFENGALALSNRTHAVTRLALGATPLSGVRPTPTPRPSPTPTATDKAGEGTIVLPVKTPTASPRPTTTPTSRPRATPTTTAVTKPATAGVFIGFVRKHLYQLGNAAKASYRVGVRTVQIFQYGALVYNSTTRMTALLPVGDRLLAARHYLPAYPGNQYPTGFASPDVLRAIGWLSAKPSAAH